MKFIERIKSLIKRNKSRQVETSIIFEKQCPHCTSRGMFIFNSPSQTKIRNGKSNEKKK